MNKFWAISVLLLVVVAVGAFLMFDDFLKKPTLSPQRNQNTNQIRKESESAPKISTLASNLEIPWSLVFLPDGSVLVTERPGTVRLVDTSGKLSDPVLTISDVHHQSEGGLLGVTLSPNFADNKFVYFYYTYSGDENKTLNRVVRYKFEGGIFSERMVIVDAIPGAPNHNGGRIKFGPDSYLYITAGDAQNPSLAQNTSALAGKILRVTEDGKQTPGNPFNNLVYSWGHRNPQGLAWDKEGRLWATEHGNNAHDEVNLIKPGQNYGWPIIQGNQTGDNMVKSVIESGSDTWAPSGLAYLDGYLYFGGLRGRALYRARIEGEKLVDLRPFFKDELGRIRDVVIGPDKLLYITTSNRDGRGRPAEDDDKIIVVNPKLL